MHNSDIRTELLFTVMKQTGEHLSPWEALNYIRHWLQLERALLRRDKAIATANRHEKHMRQMHDIIALRMDLAKL